MKILDYKYIIHELTIQLCKEYQAKNFNLSPSDNNFSNWHLDCLVQQKLATIVSRQNGRRILKFNVVDAIKEDRKQFKNIIECICYEETHDMFDHLIKEGEYIRIYNPDISSANKSHTHIDNEYRIIMTESSEIIKIEGDD